MSNPGEKSAMFRVMNDYLANMKWTTNEKIYGEINSFFEKEKSVNKVCVNVNFNTYIIDVRMTGFNIKKADGLFRKFKGHFSYPYSKLSVRYNEGSRVVYRYATCQENKTGVYMQVIFS